MTALQKLRDIMSVVINFDSVDGNPKSLEPVLRQIDILGGMIGSDNKAYKKLASARKILKIMVDTNSRANSKIEKALKYLYDAQELLFK